jgi:hypothetical protein
MTLYAKQAMDSRQADVHKSSVFTVPLPEKIWTQAIWCVIVASQSWSFATLARNPAAVTPDEGGYSAAALQFWKSGRCGVPPYGDYLGFNEDFLLIGRVFGFVQGWLMALAGVTVFAGQFPSFLVGVVLLGLTFLLARTLFGVAAATVATALLSTSGVFFLGSHNARPDILLALCLASTLTALALYARDSKIWQMVLAGTSAAAGFHVHPNGVLLLAPIAVFGLSILGPARAASLRAITAFVLPVLLGFAAQGLLYGTASPIVASQLINFGGGHITDRLGQLNPVVFVPREILRYGEWFIKSGRGLHAPEGLLVGGSILASLIYGKRSARALVATWATLFAIGGLMMPWKWYLIYAWPLFVVIVAGAVTSLRQEGCHAKWLVVPVLLLNLIQLGWWDRLARRDEPFSASFNELRAAVPADARVLGPGQFWFAFSDLRFTDALYLELAFYSKQDRTRTPDERCSDFINWAKNRWDYIVADGSWRERFDPDVPLEPLVTKLRDGNEAYLLSEELRRFSEQCCRVIHRINNGPGEIIILQVNCNAAR